MINSFPIDDIEKTWDYIAESFDKTRRYPWPVVTNFIDALDSNFIIGDFGCGNGRHSLYAAVKGFNVISFDISMSLLSILDKKISTSNQNARIQLLHGSMVQIPLKDCCIDAGIAIASIHNIPNHENRVFALKEIFRVLKPKGKVLVSVWSKNQDRYRKSLQNVNQNDHFINDFKSGDTIIFWNQDKLHIPRYYHFYDKNELKKDIQKAGFEILTIKDVSLSSKNEIDNYFASIMKP